MSILTLAAILTYFLFPEPFEAQAPARGTTRAFGVVVHGTDAVHTFLIYNGSDKPLALKRATGPPNLSVAILDATIPAGGEGRVEVKVDTFAVAGPARLRATIETDAAERPQLLFEVTIDVRAYIIVQPMGARYDVVRWSPEGGVGHTLWAADGAPFKILSLESPYSHLRVAFRPAQSAERDPSGPEQQWRIESTIATDAPVGAIAGFVVARTDHPRQKNVWIPVTGFVRPLFAVTPPTASLGDVSLSRRRTSGLHVKNFATEPIAIQGATTDVAGLRASVLPIEDGRSYRVELAASDEAQPGPFSGLVKIQTASEKEPVIEVPVTGRFVEN